MATIDEAIQAIRTAQRAKALQNLGQFPRNPHDEFTHREDVREQYDTADMELPAGYDAMTHAVYVWCSNDYLAACEQA